MASPLAVANRKDIRRLEKLRKDREAAERQQATREERQRHERLVVARMTKRMWRPPYAAFLGIAWDYNWPPAPPEMFDHYAYWQARRCGWDVLRREFVGVWPWWAALSDKQRDSLADLRRASVLRTGDQVDERIDPKEVLGRAVSDVEEVRNWGRGERKEVMG
ncbi:MAG TPA: hypothetical protein VGN72_06600 [Tepidisphaeraceae bacterium]|jgi:hypothetical protein|nr:hypothetical protein [Tepidisphaeraceae bacterium]